MNPELEEEEEGKQLEEEEEEEEKGKEGEKEGEEKGKSGEEEKSESDRKELGMEGQIVVSAESKSEKDIEESLRQHCDSASTLGHSSAHQSSLEDTTELLPLVTSPEDAKAVVVTVDQELEEGEGQQKEEEASDETGANKKDTSSDGEFHTPQVVSMEPGLTPINEEPQKSDEKEPSLSQPQHQGRRIFYVQCGKPMMSAK